MLPLAMKTKAAFVLITAAIASAGALTGIVLSRHSQNVAASSADIPLPTAPPLATPGPINPANAQAFSNVAGTSVEASPTPAPAQLVQVQYVPSATPAPTVYQSAPVYYPVLSPQQLDQLLGPIALYPDPLIAQMLSASTYPDQLGSAAFFVSANASPPDYVIDGQPWEPSVKSLAHTPSVLVWMYNNPDWTRTLGTAVTYQQAEVLTSIQRLRVMAMNAGSLYTTPQQLVLAQDNNICIEPAMTDVVYVPVYDWRTCYTRRYEPTFFVGARIGGWFDGDCDWNDRFITFGARWDRGWDHRWDHDRDAREVIVRNPRDNDRDRRPDGSRITNNTTIVNNNTTVRVGGTPWQRNDARPAPTLPASVRPSRPGAAPTSPRTPDRPAITPRSDTGDRRGVTPAPRDVTPIPRDGNRRDVTPNPRVITPDPTPTPPARNPRDDRGTPAGRDGRGAIPATPATPAPGGRALPANPATPPDRTPDVTPRRGNDGRGANPTPPARGNPGRGTDDNPGRGNPGRGNDGNSQSDKVRTN